MVPLARLPVQPKSYAECCARLEQFFPTFKLLTLLASLLQQPNYFPTPRSHKLRAPSFDYSHSPTLAVEPSRSCSDSCLPLIPQLSPPKILLKHLFSCNHRQTLSLCSSCLWRVRSTQRSRRRQGHMDTISDQSFIQVPERWQFKGLLKKFIRSVQEKSGKWVCLLDSEIVWGSYKMVLKSLGIFKLRAI